MAGLSFRSRPFSSSAGRTKFLMKPRNSLHHPRKGLSYLSEVGGFNLRIALVECCSIFSLQGHTKC